MCDLKMGDREMPASKELGADLWYAEDECKFTHRYQRNNKRGGLKNLRCFPTCAEEHKERGFCGRSVLVHARIPSQQPLSSLPIKCTSDDKAHPSVMSVAMQSYAGFACIGEFVKADGVGLVSVGDRIEHSLADSRIRSKKEPTKPWILGEVVRQDNGTDFTSEVENGIKEKYPVVVFEFNKDRKGWHYGWASNKHTCNAKHCLQIYLFRADSPSKLSCVRIIRSIPFMLFCRRRRRFVCIPSAPISPPKKRKQATSQISASKKKVKLVKKESEIQVQQKENNDKNKNIVNLEVAKIERIFSGIIRAVSALPENSLKNVAQGTEDPLDLPSTSVNEDTDELWNLSLDHDILDSIDVPSAINTNGLAQNNLLDFSASISDCLDFFSTNSENEIQFDFTDPEVNLNEVHSNDITPIEREAIIEDLAQYLLTETSFTTAIHKLREWIESQSSDSKVSTPNCPADSGYETFISVLNKNLTGFMKKHSLSKEQLNQVFQINEGPISIAAVAAPNDLEKPSGFFTNVYESFKSVVNSGSKGIQECEELPRKISINGKTIPNHSGRWVRDGEGQMELIYEKIGIPWLLIKMMGYMEAQCEIQQNGLEVHCRLRRKLLSNGTVTMILDGNERPFGLRLPILTSLSENWTHRAFANGNTITAIHTFGKHRLFRVSWLSEDRNILHTCVSLELYDENAQKFVEEMEVSQDSHRMK